MRLLISALQLSHRDTHTDGHADAYNHTGALQLRGLQLSAACAAGLHLHVHVGL
jgi:hypothetical protein